MRQSHMAYHLLEPLKLQRASLDYQMKPLKIQSAWLLLPEINEPDNQAITVVNHQLIGSNESQRVQRLIIVLVVR